MSLFDVDRARWLVGELATENMTHIVDVGANPIELVTYKELLDVGLCKVTGFEPQVDAFEKLQQIKGPNETYFNWAVGAGTERDLFITKMSGLTSIFRADLESCNFLSPRFVRGMAVKSVMPLKMCRLDDSDVKKFDLLKIDIQGGELEVFRGAHKLLSDAVAVIPEVRLARMYLDEPMIAGVDSDLRARGYIFHKFLFIKSYQLRSSQGHRLNRRNKSQAVDGDAVYIRDLSNPDAVSSEQIKQLAILADSIWFSFDLVLHCLDILVARGEIAENLPEFYVDRLPQKVKNDE